MASDLLGSGGMNGYLSLCHGDPCPPIFRSPIMGMEDIMNNQVLCAIYRVPDAHKHITRPPAGVIFPNKIVTVGDLKPPPTLWHEDNGRKPWNGDNGRKPWHGDNGRTPWESGRQNPPRTISGRELGEAARKLVVNSLQSKWEDQMHAQPPPPYYVHALMRMVADIIVVGSMLDQCHVHLTTLLILMDVSCIRPRSMAMGTHMPHHPRTIHMTITSSQRILLILLHMKETTGQHGQTKLFRTFRFFI